MRPRLLLVGLMFGWCGVLAAALPASSGGAPVNPASSPALHIVDGVEAGSIGSFTIDNADFMRTLRIKSTTDAAASGVGLKATVVTDPSGGDATLLIDGVEDKVQFGAIPGRESRLVHLKGDLPVPGNYQFSLTVTHADGPPQIFGLMVERSAPTVELVEAKGTSLTLVADAADYETQLVLRTTTKVPAESVVVTVPAFTDSDGRPVAVRIEDGDADVELGTIRGLGVLPFKLAATLSESGKYNGTLDVTYLGGRITYALSIEKRLTAATLTGSSAAGGAMMLGEEGVPSLHVSLRETGGRRLEVRQPSLSRLTRTLGTAAPVQGRYKHVTFFDSDDEEIKQWPIPLSPNAPFDLRMDLGGVEEPGHFAGKLLIPAVDHSPVDVAIEFDVRRHWRTAALCIAVGVIVSLLMRLWATRLRPSMRQLQSVLQTLIQLGDQRKKIADLRAEERTLFDSLRERLALVYEELRIAAREDAEPTLSMLRAQLKLVPDWIAVNRQLTGLEPEADFRSLRDELNEVRDYLLDPSPAENDHSENAEILSKLPGKIKTKIGKVLSDFLKTLGDLGRQLGDDTLKDDWQEKVVDKATLARGWIDQVNFPEASRVIDQARREAAKLLAQALRKIVPQRQPGWMTQQRYERIGVLLGEVEVETESGGTAVTKYRDALALYLAPYARDIAKRVDTLIEHLNQRLEAGDAAPDKIGPTTTVLAQASSKLDGVTGLISEGLLGEAALACQEAETTYRDSLGGLPAALQLASAARVAKSVAGAAPAGYVPDLTLPVPAPALPESHEAAKGAFARVGATIGAIDWLYQVLVALIAIAVGVYVLWAGSPTWGSEADILIAVLWGLGVHALTTGPTAYKGLADLAGKLGS